MVKSCRLGPNHCIVSTFSKSSLKKECKISNSTFLILEVQTFWFLGFDNTSPYSLQSISVNYFDDVRKLITGQNTDLFQELGKTTEV